MSERGKLVGGAAVGAGGVLVALLRGGGTEVHLAESGLRAARMGTEAVAVERAGVNAATGGVRAGGGAASEVLALGAARGAGALGHGAEDAVLIEHAMLPPPSDLRLHAFEPPPIAIGLGQAGTKARGASAQAAKGGAKVATVAPRAGAARRITAAARDGKIKDALAHSTADEPAELLDHLLDAWDLTDLLPQDEDDDVEREFQKSGLDFRADVAPSVRGMAVDGIAGATRELLTDGKMLVPAIRLPAESVGRLLSEAERSSAVTDLLLASRTTAYYVEVDVHAAGIPASERGLPLMIDLERAKDVEWRELTTTDGELRLTPPIIEVGTHRLRALAGGPIHREAPVSRIILISQAPS
jgi:hypothetical protein